MAGTAAKFGNVGKHYPGEKRYKLLIPLSKDDKQPVALSVNGEAIKVKRGAEVEVSERFYEVLKNAVMTTHTYDEKSGQMVKEEINRIPYVAQEVETKAGKAA